MTISEALKHSPVIRRRSGLSALPHKLVSPVQWHTIAYLLRANLLEEKDLMADDWQARIFVKGEERVLE